MAWNYVRVIILIDYLKKNTINLSHKLLKAEKSEVHEQRFLIILKPAFERCSSYLHIQFAFYHIKSKWVTCVPTM